MEQVHSALSTLEIAQPMRDAATSILKTMEMEGRRFHMEAISVDLIDDDILLLFWRGFHFEISFYEESNEVLANATVRMLDSVTHNWTQRDMAVVFQKDDSCLNCAKEIVEFIGNGFDGTPPLKV